MRVPLALIFVALFALTACQTTRTGGAVVVVADNTPATAPSQKTQPPPAKQPSAKQAAIKKSPPPQAPAYGQRAKNGPPSHAPAHGYRYQHRDGIELVFDAGLGIYTVVNVKDMYFDNDLYLRFYNDSWMVAVRFDGPWEIAQESQIPPKLKKVKKTNNGKGNSK